MMRSRDLRRLAALPDCVRVAPRRQDRARSQTGADEMPSYSLVPIIGTTLVERIVDLARAEQCNYVVANVRHSDATAQAFFSSQQRRDAVYAELAANLIFAPQQRQSRSTAIQPSPPN
jgi:hypothetical protein